MPVRCAVHLRQGQGHSRHPGRIYGLDYVNGHDITASTVWLDSWQTSRLGARNKLGLTTHELGHAIGLSHASNKSSLMYPLYEVAPSTPSAGDFANINARY